MYLPVTLELLTGQHVHLPRWQTGIRCLDHVKDNDAWEILERRVNKTAVEQFKSVNDDLPPGINWSETQVINFRRK